jgi:hypothetical protein
MLLSFALRRRKITQNLRNGADVIFHSGTLSSFVFLFGALRAPKRNTDKRTMLLQARRTRASGTA